MDNGIIWMIAGGALVLIFGFLAYKHWFRPSDPVPSATPAHPAHPRDGIPPFPPQRGGN